MPFINIRVSDEDLAHITAHAEEIGVPISVYVRCMAMTGQPPVNKVQCRPVAFSVFHDPLFVRRLPDAKLKEMLGNADPLAVHNARAELERRDRITSGLLDETAVDPSIEDQRGRRLTPSPTAPRKRRAPPRHVPRHLQANNPAAKELARAMASLDDEALARKHTTSIDPVMIEAAAKELERRKRGIRLFRR